MSALPPLGRVTDAGESAQLWAKLLSPELESALSNPGAWVSPDDFPKENEVEFVPIGAGQFSFSKTDNNMALHTSGMAPCSALIIIDQTSGWQVMFHLLSGTSVKGLALIFERTLRNIDFSRAEIYIMPGKVAREPVVEKRKGTLAEIYKALLYRGVTTRQIKFVKGDPFHVGVTLWRGKIYAQKPPMPQVTDIRPPLSLSEWLRLFGPVAATDEADF